MKVDWSKPDGQRVVKIDVVGSAARPSEPHLHQVAMNSYVAFATDVYPSLANARLLHEYGTCDEALRALIAQPDREKTMADLSGTVTYVDAPPSGGGGGQGGGSTDTDDPMDDGGSTDADGSTDCRAVRRTRAVRRMLTVRRARAVRPLRTTSPMQVRPARPTKQPGSPQQATRLRRCRGGFLLGPARLRCHMLLPNREMRR